MTEMRLRGEYEFRTDKERVDFLANLIEEGSQSPKIREFTLKLLNSAGCGSYDYNCEIRTIFNWVRDNIVYRRHVLCRDSFTTADRVFELRSGDCLRLHQKIIVKHKENDKYELAELGSLKNCYDKYQALSYNFYEDKFEFKNIVNWVNKGIKDTIKVRLLNGHTFNTTPDHMFYAFRWEKRLTDSRVYLINLSDIKKLTEHELLAIPDFGGQDNLDGKTINKLIFTTIKEVKFDNKLEVCDITVEDNHNFVLSNGLLVHNCDNMVTLLNSMLVSVGIPTGVRIISTDYTKSYHHIYSLAGVPPSEPVKWIPLDPTQKNKPMGWEPKYAKKKDFMVICG